MRNVGIIGYGGFGQFLHKAWDSLPGAKIVAIADQAQIDITGQDVKFYADWKDLLLDSSVTIVSIATPPSTHAQIACAAMEAGKHILIEKPLATSMADAQTIIDTRDDTGQVASVDFMLRFNPLIESIRAISRSGVWGPLRRATIENHAQAELLPPGHWFWDIEKSGGIFVEHGVHFFDLIDWLNPVEIQDITGHSASSGDGRTDRVLASVLYENGTIATHHHAFNRPGFFEHTDIQLVFDLAEINLSGWIPLSGSICVLCEPSTESVLGQLEGFEQTDSLPISELKDDSRPEGWGDTGPGQITGKHTIQIAGKQYSVRNRINGQFGLGQSKSEAYQASIRALQNELLSAIENSDFQMRVTLEDGLKSLKNALSARDYAISNASTS